MLDLKDPAIKLFGKEIPLSPSEVSGGDGDDLACSDTSSVEKEDKEADTEKPFSSAKATESIQQKSSIIDTSQDSANLETPSVDQEETAKSKSVNGLREKTLKKPEKILPCPRCNSMDTKFCYYNNYNVNQPRHFCKSCQRYWTAGGTMRNVPVGAGRRKNKSSSSHYRHITISDALQAAQIDAMNGINHASLKNHNGIVLKFGGIDSPVHDSMHSVLNGANKKVLNGMMNGFHSPNIEKQGFSSTKAENGDDCSSGSTVSALSSTDEGSANANFPPQIPCIPGIPWPYPWSYPAVLPPPTLCPPGFSLSFYPAAFLNCSFQNNWNFPSPVPSNGVLNSPTLGKRSRDGEVLDSENPVKEGPMKRKNGSVLVPKTLRVDDPNEAAKSTIWSTLGIKNDSLCKEGFFKGFEKKCADKIRAAEKISPALLANPAALSRSLNFQESS